MAQKVIYTNFVESAINRFIEDLNPAGVYVLVDHNTRQQVLPRIQSLCPEVADAIIISVKPGDENKSLESLSNIWKRLSDTKATRRSLLINLGGGMITDMGAFAASTFKRGISFLNVPTTLLGAVDAAIGGKTGINFNGLKNEVGMFKEADAVIVSTTFFNTLPLEEIKSGYAEMLKHALISSPTTLSDLMKENVDEIEPDTMLSLLEESTNVKRLIVEQDPEEHGLRKALNLGHSVGHAFEALSLERNATIPHGYAVAYGLVVELVISSIKKGFPTDVLRKIAIYIYNNYRAFSFNCEDYDLLLGFIGHDKKNLVAGEMNFTLLNGVGNVVIDNVISSEDVVAAFDIYREELSK